MVFVVSQKADNKADFPLSGAQATSGDQGGVERYLTSCVRVDMSRSFHLTGLVGQALVLETR